MIPLETLNAALNGPARAIECAAEIARCACGQEFVRRSWNHRRCRSCQERRLHNTEAPVI